MWCGVAVAVMVRGRGTDEVRAAVGRRLAGMDHTSHTTLPDGEDSPLQQSKRSSMFIRKKSSAKCLIIKHF